MASHVKSDFLWKFYKNIKRKIVKKWKGKSSTGVSGKYARYTAGGRLKGKLHQIPARNRK